MSHPYPHGQSPFKIKGLAYRGVVRDADERIPGGLNRIAAELGDGELREFLLQPFMASSWSDVLPMLPLVETLSRRFGQSPESYTRDRARAQAAEDLDGVYKVLLKVVSPRIVATRLPRLTASYFNWGKVEVWELEARRVRASRSQIPEPLIAWYEAVTQPYVQLALTHAGGKSARFACVESLPDAPLHGLPTRKLVFEATWL